MSKRLSRRKPSGGALLRPFRVPDAPGVGGFRTTWKYRKFYVTSWFKGFYMNLALKLSLASDGLTRLLLALNDVAMVDGDRS
jgi:hypothetical protein